jgi:bleomycin hydrolase
MMIKLQYFIAGILLLYQSLMPVWAQEMKTKDGYQFKIIKELPATSVKNQSLTNTCWSFSVISMIESELLSMGKDTFDLSEMFVVRHVYEEKAEKYIRMHGTVNFAGGGFFHDVIHVLDSFGMVPDATYPGLKKGETLHNHSEMDELLKENVEEIIRNSDENINLSWMEKFDYLLDSCLGELPMNFRYGNQEITPLEFASGLDINPENYVEITSFNHHPFYEQFILEVPDNWAWGEFYNVPLDELLEIIHYSINHDYTVAWSADISDNGFSWRNGVAVVPDTDLVNMEESEMQKWIGLSEEERNARLFSFKGPVPEMTITQDLRQAGFDNYTTTDDHGMQITGIAMDTKGNKYFRVKNSWGLAGSPYKGYLYASDAYVRYKTIAIMVNKNGIPDHIREKLNIK